MFFFEMRRAFDGIVLLDVGSDMLDLLVDVTEFFESQRNCLIDDLHQSTTDELFVFHEGDIGFYAGCIAIHHEADRTGWSKDGSLGIAEAIFTSNGIGIIPDRSEERRVGKE